jgi:hypothetical protein
LINLITHQQKAAHAHAKRRADNETIVSLLNKTTKTEKINNSSLNSFHFHCISICGSWLKSHSGFSLDCHLSVILFMGLREREANNDKENEEWQ